MNSSSRDIDSSDSIDPPNEIDIRDLLNLRRIQDKTHELTEEIISEFGSAQRVLSPENYLELLKDIKRNLQALNFYYQVKTQQN